MLVDAKDVVLLLVGSVLGALIGLMTNILFEDRWLQFYRRQQRRREVRALRHLHHQSSDDEVVIGNRLTRVRLIDGDGQVRLENSNVRVRIVGDRPRLPEEIRLRRQVLVASMDVADEHGARSAWNQDDLVTLLKYSLHRVGAHEESALDLTVSACDYATFAATVLAMDEPLANAHGETLRTRYLGTPAALDAATTHPIPFLANGLGLSLVLVTEDGHLLLSRRRPTGKARPGELDVTIAEGLHIGLDQLHAGELDVYSGVKRACQEEMGLRVSDSDIHLLGFALDTQYYQWNFLGLIEVPMPLEQVIGMRGLHAKDRWEGSLVPVADNPDEVFFLLGKERAWDLALVGVYMALCFRHGSGPTHRAAARHLK